MTLGIASGQQPNPDPQSLPTPLLPAEQAWVTTLEAPPSAPGAMDRERVYIPQQNDQITALDRETGEVAWVRAIESSWPPVVGDGAVFLAASDEFHALDAATGGSRWRVGIDRPLLAPPTFADGSVLAIIQRGDVISLRSKDGSEAWRHRLGSDSPRSALVPGEAGTVYVSLDRGQLVALSLADGHEIWRQTLPGALSDPVWAPGRVFVGSTDNFFYALDSKDGSLKWKWRSGGDVIGAAVDEGLVFFASLDNVIRAVNRGNGNQRWRKDTGTRPLVPPKAFGRLALVAGTSPTLTGFSAKDGSAAGTYLAPGELEGEPLIDPVLRPYSVAAVVVLRDGQVVGLSPVAMLFKELPAAPMTGLPGRVLQREQSPQRRN